ncbi:MAG: IS1595 family transposase [Caulobacterales bacterium]
MRDNSFSAPIFHDEKKAREWLEARLWAEGPICPKCGVVDQATLMRGKTTRPGLYQCNACREPFTVTVGTLYERSHVPLHKWLAATYLMMSSKKGMSALQIGRMIGVTYKTAWFLCHRIRESLRESDPPKLGGEGKIVEADETYVGGKDKNRHASQMKGKNFRASSIEKEPVVALVERGGRVRSTHVGDVNIKTLRPILTEQIHKATHVMTDQHAVYPSATRGFAQHSYVNHGLDEYVRGDVSTNTVESYFAILKRGIFGTFHHVSAQHLKRYVGEFDYRYNTRIALGFGDMDRFTLSFPGIVGKRLTYRRTGGEQAPAAPAAPSSSWIEWRTV